MMNDLFTHENKLRIRIRERLGSSELDFRDQMHTIQEKQKRGEKWSASGILLLLEFDTLRHENVIVLNKRSLYVQQPGDLCCPGGGTGHRLDRILGYLLSKNYIPYIRSNLFRNLQFVPNSDKRILGMVIAAALRESWEEMRLPPWRVEYLGSLRTHRLQSFPKIIFPVVGRTTGRWRARPNWEVEKIVRVPIRSFFNPDNYAQANLIIPSPLKKTDGLGQSEHPCLVVQEENHKEILWGATFNIIINFLRIVMDLPMELIHSQNKVEKNLPIHYFTGKPRK